MAVIVIYKFSPAQKLEMTSENESLVGQFWHIMKKMDLSVSQNLNLLICKMEITRLASNIMTSIKWDHLSESLHNTRCMADVCEYLQNKLVLFGISLTMDFPFLLLQDCVKTNLLVRSLQNHKSNQMWISLQTLHTFI